MGAAVLDGEALATLIRDELRGRIELLRAAGRPPGLATLLVGDDQPSARYVAMKHRD
jgi:methylenetetrahydrofolate dehydrogenase (NADP+)/methenyltetrahydrofolate cyclohydrolase